MSSHLWCLTTAAAFSSFARVVTTWPTDSTSLLKLTTSMRCLAPAALVWATYFCNSICLASSTCNLLFQRAEIQDFLKSTTTWIGLHHLLAERRAMSFEDTAASLASCIRDSLNSFSIPHLAHWKSIWLKSSPNTQYSFNCLCLWWSRAKYSQNLYIKPPRNETDYVSTTVASLAMAHPLLVLLFIMMANHQCRVDANHTSQ